MLLNDLVGTWFLQEWDCTLNGDYHNHPFGKHAQGVITYSPGGRMSAVLMKANRANLSVPSLLQATDEEKVSAVNGYVSYAGQWRVDGDQVSHLVDFSLLPNWIGTDLIRMMSWTKEFSAADEPTQLILSTTPQATRSGKMVVNRLRWKMK
jgi:hypothetical protein